MAYAVTAPKMEAAHIFAVSSMPSQYVFSLLLQDIMFVFHVRRANKDLSTWI
jgi:hypothetical protein